LQQAQVTLDKLANKANSDIEHSGSALSENAANYIPRDSDSLLKQRFDNETTYFWINGGIKKGKSSLLNQAKKECQARGISYHLCDFGHIIKASSNSPADPLCYQQVFQFLFTQTTKSDYQFQANEFAELCEEFKAAFSGWRIAGTPTGEKYFIAIDHLDSLIDPQLIQDNYNSAHDFNPFITIHFILQVCLGLSRELSDVYFALVVEDYLYINAKVSPLISQSARIDLKPLTCEEIVKLWQIIKPQQSSVEINLIQAKIIYEKVGGNPFLIQSLLQNIYQHHQADKTLFAYIEQLKQKIENRADQLTPTGQTYHDYKTKVITTLKKISALTAFSDNIETLSYDELITKLSQLESTVLDPNVRRSLERLGFIDESNHKLKPFIELILNGTKEQGLNKS
jgi:hypothetical protein